MIEKLLCRLYNFRGLFWVQALILFSASKFFYFSQVNLLKKYLGLKYTGIILLSVIFLSGCVADDFLNENGNSENPGLSYSGHTPNSFFALRVYSESDADTRVAFDSDKDKTDEERNTFSSGLPFEYALYLPEPEKEEDDDAAVVDLDSSGDTDNSGGSDDKKEEILKLAYHFAVLFDKDGNLLSNDVLPLTWDKSSETEDYYTLYAKFYDPAKEDIPFQREFDGYVMTVLNASYHLEKEIRDWIKTTYADQEKGTPSNDVNSNNNSFSKFKKLEPRKPADVSEDYYLYLQDKDNEYIRDNNGNPYLTMTSSMIGSSKGAVSSNSLVISPAVDGGFTDDDSSIPAFTFYSTESDAKKHPTSIYVERLLSKFTVLFMSGNNTTVGTDNDIQGAKQYVYYYLTTSKLPSSTTGNYIPTNRLFLSPESESKNKIKYVTGYTRSETIDKRRDVPVKETLKWKVNVIGWSINGRESSEYLFKNLSSSASDNLYYPGWQKNAYPYRTFWAEDLHYKDGFYPDQFTAVTNDTQDNNDNVKSYNSGMTLDYFNFSELSGKQVRLYSTENTFNTSILGTSRENRDELRKGSHLIITGQLLIGGESANNDDFEISGVYNSQNFNSEGLVVNFQNGVRDKYYMNDIYWDEASYMNYVTEYLGYWLLTAENKAIFGNNDGCFYVNTHGAKANGTYFRPELVQMKGGDNIVWIRPAENVKLYVFDPDWEEESQENQEEQQQQGTIPNFKKPSPYTEITFDQYKKLAFEHQNYFAQVFKDGKMYYTTGCPHNPNATLTTGYNVGDFGTVRNHWYYYIIKEITTPGIGVFNPSNKIIPNNVPENNGMGVSIRVLNWHKEFISTDVSGQRPHNPSDGSTGDGS